MQTTPQEPLEKPSYWRRGMSWLAGAVGGTLLLAGIFTICFSLLQIFSEWRYRSDGATAEGLVTKLVTSEEEQGKTYRVDYRFDTPHGRFEGNSEVPLELWNKLQVNRPVVVQYRAHDPSSNRVQGQGNWLLIAIVMPLGALFFGIGRYVRGFDLR